jgi:hypothetical protein
MIRNAPLSNNTQIDPDCVRSSGENAGTSLLSSDGWFEDAADSTTLRKNFQVDAYVLPLVDGNPDPNGTVATLEFQQDREATQGFRWAAWFRNDLEIFPGPPFNWNGAMHTEGSYFIAGNRFKAYMVSDPDSCLYKENASTITTPTTVTPAFQGQFISGELRGNVFGGSNRIDLWDGEKRPPITSGNTFDMSKDSLNPGNKLPVDFSLDPVRLHTEDVSVSRGVPNPATYRDSNWSTRNFSKRMKNQEVKRPYLDDTFRADNRYGPKPTTDESGSGLSTDIGTPIVGNLKLTDENEGLDGYWERRARKDGLRIIVGQRLELGDPAGWGGPTSGQGNDDINDDNYDVANLHNEPLRPWAIEKGCTGSRCNEARQRRTLWDNLAAVQATAIYHKATGNPDYPAACIATTVHPGTAGTLDKSATFENLAFGFKDAFAAPYNVDGRVISDFFRGRGTNGWEYSLPPETALTNSSSAMVKALKNLANFAGDPLGGAPSFTPVQNTGSQGVFPHPLPAMAMWGDFSMLRRILGTNYTSATYNGLSMADKTTLHTAACMLSMLAYNIDYLNKFNYTDPSIASLLGDAAAWTGLRGHIRAIDAMIYDSTNGDNDGQSAGVPESFRKTIATKAPDEIKKLKAGAMDAMAWIKAAAGSQGSNDPETYVRLLEFWRDAATDNTFKEQLTKEIALARLIITKEQVARDRKFGFGGRYALRGDRLLSDRCEAWYAGASSSAFSFKDAANQEPLMRLCSDRPRYPVLFSLFPLIEHGDVSDTTTVSDPSWKGQKIRFMVRDGEDNFSLTPASLDSERTFNYLRGASPAGNINKNVKYEPLLDADIADIAARPKALGGLGFSGTTWTLPSQYVDSGRTPNGSVVTETIASGTTLAKRYDLIKICPTTGTWQAIACSRVEKLNSSNLSDLRPVTGPRYRIPFKDSAFMNGRELMSVRTLNLDLELMKDTAVGSDYWLPKSGIIYAFREDAVSEAHIVRPAKKTWEDCKTVDKLLTVADCQMNTATVSALDSKDPPINDRNISPKPVDFFPDPDRRPYGFRLRNGAALWRGSVSGSDITDNADGRGLSFITHNPAYVQGYFNLHRPVGKGLNRADGWEEFKDKLNTADFDNNAADGTKAFYGRSNLEENFADRQKDQWRPAEVLGDAVTLLSPYFCDGSIEDGIITAAISNGTNQNDVGYGVRNDALTNFVDERYGCSGSNNRTSYLNQNRATKTIAEANQVKWMRSSIADTYWRAVLASSDAGNSPTGRSESPIYIFRNGDPMSVLKPTADVVQMNEYPGTSNDYAAMRPSGGSRDLMTVPNNKDIQMNMILISGLVPSRANQSYGGLHNFPRFIETWGSPLYFSGALLQLNFSTYATAPFDQEQWQPGLPDPLGGSGANEWIPYYGPPDRRWGFDVGLKYAPPGPVAERFKSPEPTRSEFYDEPPANDPYIKLLGDCAQAPNSCGA